MPKIIVAKEDWIKLGYQLFSDSGETGLNVDKMSRLLKCNKSSFYWHFKTKKNFLQALIEHWITQETATVVAKVNKQATPQKRFLTLLEMAFKKDANLDFIFFLKRYAQSDKPTAKIVEQIDLERIDFTSNLLIELGYSKENALLKAGLFYKYLIGYHEMIRYKKQEKNYLQQVLLELNQFIKINGNNKEKK